ncbi:MAG: hypothetical protein HY608_11780 [Planctomycetes bacterium]|nr:hypothetical protein [Planctomycetota bacterium]
MGGEPTKQDWVKAEKIFRRACESLGPEQDGRIMAIDVLTGETFLGDTERDAYAVASRTRPGREFIFMRVGRDVPHFIGAF